jgi:hypothetical protein
VDIARTSSAKYGISDQSPKQIKQSLFSRTKQEQNHAVCVYNRKEIELLRYSANKPALTYGREGQKIMKRFVLCILLMGMVITACNPGIPSPAADPTETTPALIPSLTSESTSQPKLTETAVADEQSSSDGTSTPLAAQTANCASSDANQLGMAIAKDYDFTSTEQVMKWFCDGAEFEDILVALETADQTGASAEEMLTMLAAGMTWEEIWQVVGLTD